MLAAPDTGRSSPESSDSDNPDAAEPLEDAVAVLPSTDDAPPLPSEADEAAMISEMRERGEVMKPVARPADADEEADAKAKLPPLDSLVKQVSPDVLETLDELFRAKWVGVRKVPKAVLKES